MQLPKGEWMGALLRSLQVRASKLSDVWFLSAQGWTSAVTVPGAQDLGTGQLWLECRPLRGKVFQGLWSKKNNSLPGSISCSLLCSTDIH